MPVVDVLQHPHWGARGGDGPMPTLAPLGRYQEAHLQGALGEGGSRPQHITSSPKDCDLSFRISGAGCNWLGAM